MSAPLAECPVVSIVTLCYNQSQYLGDYFGGLLSQTYRNLELIIVDDNSTDSSWSAIGQHQPLLRKKFHRVICKRNDRNLGFFGALEKAQGHITGEYLCFLDADDYYYPDKILENVRYLNENPDTGLVHSDVDFLFVKSGSIERNWWKRTFIPPQGKVFDTLVLGNYITTCTFCCRTALFRRCVNFKEYEAAGYRMADHPMLLDLSRRTEFGFIERSLACYRVLERSSSHFSDVKKFLEFRLSAFQVSLDYIGKYDRPKELKTIVLRQRAKYMFEYGYLLGLGDVCWEGYSWLREYSPTSYATFSNWLRAVSSRYKVLHMISRAWRVIGNFGNRSSRTWGEPDRPPF